MPYYQTWEEFARAAEKLYLTDPMKVRVVLKYRHCDGNLCIKVTDNAVEHELRYQSLVELYLVDVERFLRKYEHYGLLALEDKSEDRYISCLQYKTDQAQDVKKIEKLHGKLMRLMVSKETHSGAMETD